jgi:hypothetical protein
LVVVASHGVAISHVVTGAKPPDDIGFLRRSLARNVLMQALTMEPNNPNLGVPGTTTAVRDAVPPVTDPGEGIADIDATFDNLANEARSAANRFKAYVQPKLVEARDYMTEHKTVTMLAGFGLGFTIGRLLRRS